jgi:protein TonB
MLQNAASSAVLQWIYAPQPVEIQTRAVTSFPPGDSLPSDGGGSRPAILIYRKEPVYPEEARQNEIKGTVELAITIGTDGRVTAARPLRGHPLLARAAGEAVLQWRYRPATVDGTAVEVESQVLLKFIGDRADR